MTEVSREKVIPVVDLKGLTEDPEEQKKIAAQIRDVFLGIGFVAVSNHNVSPKQIAEVWKRADEFFALNTDVKTKYRRLEDDDKKYGWEPLASEKLYNRDGSKQAAGDYKECYDVIPARQVWPNEVPEFGKATQEFFTSMKKVAHYMFRMLAMALNLEDPEFFNQYHHLGEANNLSNVRFLRYPPVPEEGLEEGQMRCGEHTDFGSITLLIQDENGGLEVMRRDGQWFETIPEPNTIMMNIGDMMQRWTADKFISTRHRVRLVDDEVRARRTRRSLVLFTSPDLGVRVTCVDGSSRYPEFDANEYIWSRAAEVRSHQGES